MDVLYFLLALAFVAICIGVIWGVCEVAERVNSHSDSEYDYIPISFFNAAALVAPYYLLIISLFCSDPGNRIALWAISAVIILTVAFRTVWKTSLLVGIVAIPLVMLYALLVATVLIAMLQMLQKAFEIVRQKKN